MLKNRDSLLVQIAEQLKAYERTAPVHIRVCLYADGERVMEWLGFAIALDAIVSGLYWDEAHDWRDADTVTLGTY
jgi:hypothetical protein